MDTKRKGTFTLRTAAVLFVLSAMLEFVFWSTEVTLFGAIRGGAVAYAYHLLYAILYAVLGVGLWTAQRWAYPTVFATTAICTVDNLQTIFSRDVIVEWQMQEMATIFDRLKQEMAGKEELLQFMNKEELLRTMNMNRDSMLNAVVLLSVLFIACWWGFAWYTHLRRDYFKPGAGHSS